MRRSDGRKMQSQSSWRYGGYNQGGQGGVNNGYDDSDIAREPGSRRRRLAAMAGSMYRAGVAAASEMKEQYNNTRIRGVDSDSGGQITIPGSFPDVAIAVQGDEQMVLFPSYAKRHIRNLDRGPEEARSSTQPGTNDEQYWHQEWARHEDEKAIVDVDVRGWVYSPHKGQLSRKNRMLIGLARRLSGIPPPMAQSEGGEGGESQGYMTHHQLHEEQREQQRIAKEAEAIEKRGQGEKEVATRGGYSEPPKEDDSDIDGASLYQQPTNWSVGTPTPIGSAPSSPQLKPAKPGTWNTAADLTEAELAVANANLMARLGPFLTTPLMQQAVTIFFYNDDTSQSRTVMTNDSGHFNIRAALDFVPTHVRVLANEDLSAVEPVRVIESKGISVISDIDDTIKKSNISLGAREIFRNTFIRDWGDMCVEGVREWYGSLHDMGAQFHYCSNSPWQLFPVLATFLKGAGIPPGSLHLKQYSGMLQGIFEPVAERKKGTLERLMRDFPERKFLLVGDSGEADLEVYTELAQANPGRILAIFIRDVTTPPDEPGYFDTAVDPALLRRKAPATAAVSPSNDESDAPTSRPMLPSRITSAPPKPEPVIGDLIDFSDEPEQIQLVSIDSPRKQPNSSKPETSPLDLLGRRPPPPRPSKPMALRSAPSDSASTPQSPKTERTPPPLPNPRRKPTGSSQKTSIPSPLSQTFRSEDSNSSPISLKPPPPKPLTKSASSASLAGRPAPPLPRRRGTPTPGGNRSPRLVTTKRVNSGSSDLEFEGLGPSATGAMTPTAAQAAVNRKVDLWHRRLARAQGVLHELGTQLYTWRRGEDVVLEATGIAREALRALGKGR